MISVSHLTALDAPPEDFIAYAAAAKFDAVGLRINPPKHTPERWPIAGDLQRAKALRRQADDLGIAILEVEAFSIWPETDVRKMLPALETGAELNARFVLAAGIDDDEERLVANYAKLCEAAAGFNLSVAMEFMPFRPMRSLPDALRVLGKVAQPNAGILVDALHLIRSGGLPADVAALSPGTVSYVHLCDALARTVAPADFAEEARTNRLYPGEGGLPLAELLQALPADTPLSLEAPNARYADRSAEAQIRIAGEVTRGFIAKWRPNHTIGRADPRFSTSRAAGSAK